LYIKDESVGNQEYDIAPFDGAAKSLDVGPRTPKLLPKKKRLPTL
jgi:hypothetical protein